MPRKRTTIGETESLNGLLDTMTNVVGVLILMMLASFLSVKQVAHIAGKRNALINRDKDQQLSTMRFDLVNLDRTLEILKAQAANSGEAEQQRRELVMLVDTRNNRRERADSDGGILAFNPGTVQVDIQAAQLRLTLLQSAVASQGELLRKLRQGGNGGPARAVPHRKVTIVSVPDPVSPPKDAHQKMFLCRNGRVKFYDADQMRILLQNGYEAAAPSDQAKSSPPNDLYPRIASYFDTHEIGMDGFRWRLNAEYDSDQSAGKTYLQLRASIEWTKLDIGDSLDKIEQKSSAYQAFLQKVSPTNNYLWFLVWPDSFAEYEAARDIANDYGFSAGWAPQIGGEMDFLMARTTITSQSPLEVPAVARQTQHHYIPTAGGGGFGGGLGGFGASSGGIGGVGGGAAGGAGGVSFGGTGGGHVD